MVVTTPVETLALRREAFDGRRGAHPAVEHMLGSSRRVSAGCPLGSARRSTAETRVLIRLADLCDVFGYGSPRTVIPLTQSDLATLAGTTRPAVNRALQAAQSWGAVSLGRGRIAVLEPDALRHLAMSPDGL